MDDNTDVVNTQKLQREKITQTKSKLFIASAVLVIWLAFMTVTFIVGSFVAFRRLKNHFRVVVRHNLLNLLISLLLKIYNV